MNRSSNTSKPFGVFIVCLKQCLTRLKSLFREYSKKVSLSIFCFASMWKKIVEDSLSFDVFLKFLEK